MNKDSPGLLEFKPKEENRSNANISTNEVLTFLANGKKAKATELVVKFINFNESIYAIRNDMKDEIWIYEEGIYVPEGKSYIKEYCRKILGLAYSNHFVKDVVNKIIADNYIDKDSFFNSYNPDEIPVLNGILNLRTRELTDFTPNKIFFNKINANYDVEAKCPIIKKHLLTVLKHSKDIFVIQELIGSCLYRKYFIEKAMMFTGDGRNGKGKTINLIEEFLGVDNTSNISLQKLEESNFAICNLVNKLANIGGDLDKRALKKTNIFKGLTGRDWMTADRKFKDFINFKNFAKMIFSANELPITYDLTPAFFNRWIILEFPYRFVSKSTYNKAKDKTDLKIMDVNIIDKLITREELDGLLLWALEGLNNLFKNKDFSYSKSNEEVKALWLKKSNSFMAFFMDDLEEDYNSKITKNDLRLAFSLYCRKHKISSVSDIAIKMTLSEKGVSDDRVTKGGAHGVYCWVGAKFKGTKIDDMGWSTFNPDGKNIPDGEIKGKEENP